MPKFTVTVNDNGIRKRVVLESATEPTEAEVLSALREDYSFLSDSDLRAFKKGDYSSISDKGLLALKVKQTSTQSTNQTDYKKHPELTGLKCGNTLLPTLKLGEKFSLQETLFQPNKRLKRFLKTFRHLKEKMEKPTQD